MVELFRCFGNHMLELLQSRHFVALAEGVKGGIQPTGESSSFLNINYEGHVVQRYMAIIIVIIRGHT